MDERDTDSPSDEGCTCHLEEIPGANAVEAKVCMLSQDNTEVIVGALEEKGELNMESLQSLAKEKKPVTLQMLIQKIAEESVHHIEEVNGEEAACATAFLMEEVVNATTTDLSGDIEHDDHEVETKVLPGGNLKTTKKRIKGTVKEAVRGLKSTISLTKLLSVDP